MSSNQASQQDIVSWFNQTYLNKGERYLRPVKAYTIFLALLRAQSGQKLLDVACGLGRLLEAAEEYKCILHGIDVSEVAVDKAKEKLPKANIQVANAESLPYADNSFELITCLGSLERMLDLNQVLSEMHRVGKKQAKYCFLVRNANTLSWKVFKQALGMQNHQGHQGANTLENWTGLFERAGFKIEGVYPDQYPLQKKKKWLSFGLARIDPAQPIESWRKLSRANEFIFLLGKAQ